MNSLNDASQTVLCVSEYGRAFGQPIIHSFIHAVVRSFVRSFDVRLLAQKVTNARMFNALQNIYFTFSLIVSVHLRPFYDKHLMLISIFGGLSYYPWITASWFTSTRLSRCQAEIRTAFCTALNIQIPNSTPLQQMENGIHITYQFHTYMDKIRLRSKISLNSFRIVEINLLNFLNVESFHSICLFVSLDFVARTQGSIIWEYKPWRWTRHRISFPKRSAISIE